MSTSVNLYIANVGYRNYLIPGNLFAQPVDLLRCKPRPQTVCETSQTYTSKTFVNVCQWNPVSFVTGPAGTPRPDNSHSFTDNLHTFTAKVKEKSHEHALLQPEKKHCTSLYFNILIKNYYRHNSNSHQCNTFRNALKYKTFTFLYCRHNILSMCVLLVLRAYVQPSCTCH